MSALDPAYVLHRRPYRDTSLLVDCLTRHQGRVQAVARGGRRAKSRWRALLHPFTPLMIQCQGQGNVVTLVAAESESSAYTLQGLNLACGFYINELLVKLLHRYDPHNRLFDDYQKTLTALNTEHWVSPWLRYFEKQLLSQLGYAIDLASDVYGNPLEPACFYQHDWGVGLIPGDGKQQSSFLGADLIALRDEVLHDKRQCQAARRFLQPLIGHLLGHEIIASRQLLV